VISPFVEDFTETVIGPIPRVATTLSRSDHLGTIGARTGFARNNYRITPGLYCVGQPTDVSPVLVTANYKLTFDALRRELAGIDCWILAIDTRGINVWCAAGKGTFSAEEVAFQVQRANLDRLVSHRELILPRLSANGVAAWEVKKLCGFKARFGPILAARLPEFLRTGKADKEMRSVTFTMAERAVLVPLEICLVGKHLLVAGLLFFLLSGIGPEIFSAAAAKSRGTTLILATLTAILAGATLTPLLLPWIPFRQFWLKGALVGGLSSMLFIAGTTTAIGVEKLALTLWICGCASYLAMNFTGSTPFTSLSGVAKEMRKGLPFQILSTVLAAIFWVAGPFV
jgi:hypothetical protein